MWSIDELKSRGNAAFKKNYWKCVLIAIILSICISGGSSSNGSSDKSSSAVSSENKSITSVIGSLAGQEAAGVTSNVISGTAITIGRGLISGVTGLVTVVFALAAVVIGLLIRLLVFNVLEIGCRRFYLVNSGTDPARLHELRFGFCRESYANLVTVQLIRHLIIFLYTLLLIVPGIIKSYEYRMVPYLLAEYPDMDTRTALEESKRMMYGQKMNVFSLDISFIGWAILSIITGGIVGIFYARPYYYATDAELYHTLRQL